MKAACCKMSQPLSAHDLTNRQSLLDGYSQSVGIAKPKDGTSSKPMSGQPWPAAAQRSRRPGRRPLSQAPTRKLTSIGFQQRTRLAQECLQRPDRSRPALQAPQLNGAERLFLWCAAVWPPYRQLLSLAPPPTTPPSPPPPLPPSQADVNLCPLFRCTSHGGANHYQPVG